MYYFFNIRGAVEKISVSSAEILRIEKRKNRPARKINKKIHIFALSKERIL